MKNLITTIVFAVLSVTSAFAGTSGKTPSAPEPRTFNLDAKVFAASVVSDSDESFGGGFGLETPVYKNLYGEVTGTYLDDSDFSIGVNALYYFPSQTPVAFYAVAGGSYEFDSEDYSVGVGAGVNYVVDETTTLFLDAVYNFNLSDDDSDDDQEDSLLFRFGVSYKF